MANNENESAITSAQWDWIDRQVKSFERDWSPEKFRAVNEYLALSDCSTTNKVLRSKLLLELIHSDLELQFRHGRRSRVADYIEYHPNLLDDSRAIAELLLEEFELRREREPGLTLDNVLVGKTKLRQYAPESNATSQSTECESGQAPASETRLSQAIPRFENPALESKAVEIPAVEIPGFTIQSLLGCGGMGIVYRALDLKLKRVVAIKFMRSGMLASQSEFDRFRREAETVAAMHHPQVLQLFNIGEHDGQPYLVLEYAPGGSLATLFNNERCGPLQAAELVRTIALGAEAIHQCGIIHRDLKPANILISKDGTAKIADFGLAKQMINELSRTKDDLALGTPSYSAPECLLGEDNRNRPTADVYSLGAILYFLLTGRAPYVGATFGAIIQQLQFGEPIAPSQLAPGIPKDLNNICLKCLEQNPNRRYATAKELAEDLSRFLSGNNVHARQLGALIRLQRWTFRNPSVAMLIATTALFLVVFSVAAVTFAAWQVHAIQVEAELRKIANQARENALENERVALTEAQAANESIQMLEQLFDTTLVGQDESLATSPKAYSEAVSRSARDIVEHAIEQMRTCLLDHPLARARLLTSIGTNALEIGMVLEARELVSEALAIYHKERQVHSVSAAATITTLARIDAEQRRTDAARQNFILAQNILRDQNAEETMMWANICIHHTYAAIENRNKGWVLEMLPNVWRAADFKSKILGRDHPHAALARSAAAIAQAFEDGKADVLLHRLKDEWSRIKDAPINPYFKAIFLDQLASVEQRVGQSSQATEHINNALAMLNLALGNTDHPIAIEIFSDAAWIAHCRGDELNAIQYQSAAVEMRLRLVGFDCESAELIRELIDRLSVAGEIQEADAWTMRLEDWHREQREFESYEVLSYQYLINRLIRKGEYRLADEQTNSLLCDLQSKTSNPLELQHKLAIQRAQIAIFRGDYSSAKGLAMEFECDIQELENKAFVAELDMQWNHVRQMCSDTPNYRLAERFKTQELPNDDDVISFHQDDWPNVVRLIDRMGQDPARFQQLEKWHTGRLHREFPKHICMAAIKLALAEQYMKSGNIERASDFAHSGHMIFCESLGQRSPQALDACFTLAKIQLKLGQTAQALKIAHQAVDLAEQACGKEHPDVGAYRLKLADTLTEAGELAKAEEIVTQSLKDIRSKIGIHSPVFCDFMEQAWRILTKAKGPDANTALMREYLSQMQKECPQGNPHR